MRFKPAIHKRWLYWVLGALWAGVGVGLCVRAILWIRSQPWWAWLAVVGALAFSVVPARFGLIRIARRNLNRLDHLPEKVCCFAFQPWRSYVVILAMILLGAGLRHSALPRFYLALLYAIMGGALIFASLSYFLHAHKVHLRFRSFPEEGSSG